MNPKVEMSMQEDILKISAAICMTEMDIIPIAGSWARKFASTLMAVKGWRSVRCALSWKLKTTTSGHRYIQLHTSTHRQQTRSMLPTPKASEGVRSTERMLTFSGEQLLNISPSGIKYGIGLRQLAEQGFLPTPVSSDATTGAIIGNNDQFKATSGLPRKINRNGKDGSVGLARLVRLLPTTVTGMHKASGMSSKAMDKRISDGRQQDISMRIYKATGRTGKLNPCFVMEMMGFPPTWTLRPFLIPTKR